MESPNKEKLEQAKEEWEYIFKSISDNYENLFEDISKSNESLAKNLTENLTQSEEITIDNAAQIDLVSTASQSQSKDLVEKTQHNNKLQEKDTPSNELVTQTLVQCDSLLVQNIPVSHESVESLNTLIECDKFEIEDSTIHDSTLVPTSPEKNDAESESIKNLFLEMPPTSEELLEYFEEPKEELDNCTLKRDLMTVETTPECKEILIENLPECSRILHAVESTKVSIDCIPPSDKVLSEKESHRESTEGSEESDHIFPTTRIPFSYRKRGQMQSEPVVSYNQPPRSDEDSDSVFWEKEIKYKVGEDKSKPTRKARNSVLLESEVYNTTLENTSSMEIESFTLTETDTNTINKSSDIKLEVIETALNRGMEDTDESVESSESSKVTRRDTNDSSDGETVTCFCIGTKRSKRKKNKQERSRWFRRRTP